MAIELVQVRPCDGKCCQESPRHPNDSGTDCIYRANATSGKDDTDRVSDQFGCKLMRGVDSLPPGEKSKIFPNERAQDVFQRTCVEWPQNTKISWRRRHDGTLEVGSTGGCCWQWVRDSD